MGRLLSSEDFEMGGGGTIAITTANAYTAKRLYMLRVDADCVFAADGIKINGASTDVRTSYLDSEGATVAAGTWIVAGGENYFSAIDLASGKVTGFKLPDSLQV